MLPSSGTHYCTTTSEFGHTFSSQTSPYFVGNEMDFISVTDFTLPSSTSPVACPERKQQNTSHQRSGSSRPKEAPSFNLNDFWKDSPLVSATYVELEELKKRKCTIVESTYQLEELCQRLGSEQSVALSFKTYADHSYQLVCILQISIPSCDFIVDTISLRSQLFQLSKIFLNPNIMKVVYDGTVIVNLLYNLLNLDLVSVFDVRVAGARISITSDNVFELGKLVCFTNANFNRDLHSADWRTRPLSPKLLQYAQEEVYVLYCIYQTFKERDTKPYSSSPQFSSPLDSQFDFSSTSPDRFGGNTVPNSMEEIYQLSNANRRRNKEKKKLKGDNTKLEPTFGMEDEEDESDEMLSGAVSRNPQEFMRKIGWLRGPNTLNPTKPISNLSPRSKGSHRRTRSGESHTSDKNKSKRRGKRHRKQGSCTYPQGDFPFDDSPQSNQAEPGDSNERKPRPSPHYAKRSKGKRSTGRSNLTI